MRLVATDTNFRDERTIRSFGLDLAYGAEENDFRLAVPLWMRIEEGSAIYVPGTEWGGIIREPWVDKEDGLTWRVYWGHTWHGVMAERILYPDPGDDYLIVAGDANDIIQQMIIRTDLGALFEAAPPCGITIPRWQFDHDDTYLYNGLCKMLNSYGCRLKVRRGGSGKTQLSAEPIRSLIDDGRGSKYGYELKIHHPVNHLKCLGKGDLAERIVIDLYADRQGNISQTQSIFGIDLREEIYDAPNADRDQLLEQGTQHLRDLQLLSEASLSLPEGASYNVDDVVGVDDADTGISVRSSISKVTVKVSGSSRPTVSNEMRDVEILRFGYPVSANALASPTGSSVFEGAGAAVLQHKAAMLANIKEAA